VRWFNTSRKEASIAAVATSRGKNKAFVDTVGGQLRLPVLLPYSRIVILKSWYATI